MADGTVNIDWESLQSEVQQNRALQIVRLQAAKAVIEHVAAMPMSTSGLDPLLRSAYDAALTTLAESLGNA